MNPGYIYILINNSFNDLIKIGSTTLGAKERAKQLSANTGIPTPFIVAYEVYVEDYIEFEKKIHSELSGFRVNPKREFFRYPLDKAIELIQNFKYKKENTELFEAIEIMPYIVKKYGDNIKESVSSMRICQDGERVYFEFTQDKYITGYLKDQIITRTDLGFIVENEWDDCMFKAKDNININVGKFLELDDISMVNCVGEIFVEEWDPYLE